MVEPSKELQLVFDKAINDAKKLMHEYVTLEHLLYAIFCEEKFCNIIGMYGADIETLKIDITTNFGASYSNIFTKSGDQGNSWIEELVDISSYSGIVTFRITGIRGK